jgi:hypothetical protein
MEAYSNAQLRDVLLPLLEARSNADSLVRSSSCFVFPPFAVFDRTVSLQDWCMRQRTHLEVHSMLTGANLSAVLKALLLSSRLPHCETGAACMHACKEGQVQQSNAVVTTSCTSASTGVAGDSHCNVDKTLCPCRGEFTLGQASQRAPGAWRTVPLCSALHTPQGRVAPGIQQGYNISRWGVMFRLHSKPL